MTGAAILITYEPSVCQNSESSLSGWKAVYELNRGVVKKSAKKHLEHGTRIQLRA